MTNMGALAKVSSWLSVPFGQTGANPWHLVSKSVPIHDPENNSTCFPKDSFHKTTIGPDPLRINYPGARFHYVPAYVKVLPRPTNSQISRERHRLRFVTNAKMNDIEGSSLRELSPMAKALVDRFLKLAFHYYDRKEVVSKRLLADVLAYRFANTDEFTEEFLAKALAICDTISRGKSCYDFLKAFIYTKRTKDMVLVVNTVYDYCNHFANLGVFFSQFAGEAYNLYRGRQRTPGFLFEIEVLKAISRIDGIEVISLGETLFTDDDDKEDQIKQQIDLTIDVYDRTTGQPYRLYIEVKAGRIKKFKDKQAFRYMSVAQTRPGAVLLLSRILHQEIKDGELNISGSVIPCLDFGALTMQVGQPHVDMIGVLIQLFTRYQPSADYATDEVAA